MGPFDRRSGRPPALWGLEDVIMLRLGVGGSQWQAGRESEFNSEDWQLRYVRG